MGTPSLISSICNKTGISKRSLARFVHVNHSMLLRYEDGTNTLPAGVLITLATIYNQLDMAKSEKTIKPKLNEEEINIIKEKAAWCIAQIYPLQKKLKAMTTCYQQANTLMLLLQKMENSDSIISPKKQRWIEDQKYQAEKKLTANGWAAQLKLFTSIELLKFEAELYEAAIL